ncbi:hypothetical protein HF086_017416 [Spodoptera exigua]|uniref:Uncharacterized protein n=1 Tax=Spodoptera exigua TaxID=7107 RepID=A0A922MC03_SPOEX|nr:hypothetical protein HF086_017416 [Spodoptera exigua]
MVQTVPYFVLVVILLQITTAFVFNDSLIDENKLKDNKLEVVETRRALKKSLSTSSSEMRLFTKIADHRCPNASGQIRPYNMHFFYDYSVLLTEEDSKSDTTQTAEEVEESSSWDSSRIAKLPPLDLP